MIPTNAKHDNLEIHSAESYALRSVVVLDNEEELHCQQNNNNTSSSSTRNRNIPNWPSAAAISIATTFLRFTASCCQVSVHVFGRVLSIVVRALRSPPSDPPLLRLYVLLFGTSRAGRTSCLHQLMLSSFIPTIPTIETICEEFDFSAGPKGQTVRLCIWDVGRKDPSDPSWRTYVPLTDCIIFVIDSCDRRRLREARDEILELMCHQHYRCIGARFVIFANKQDVTTCMGRREIESSLALPNEMKDRWRVIAGSALTGQGLRDAVRWLSITSSLGQKLNLGSRWDVYCPAPADNAGASTCVEFRNLESPRSPPSPHSGKTNYIALTKSLPRHHHYQMNIGQNEFVECHRFGERKDAGGGRLSKASFSAEADDAAALELGGGNDNEEANTNNNDIRKARKHTPSPSAIRWEGRGKRLPSFNDLIQGDPFA